MKQLLITLFTLLYLQQNIIVNILFPPFFSNSKPPKDTLGEYARRVDFLKGLLHTENLVRPDLYLYFDASVC